MKIKDMTVNQLKAQGYCRISNKYGTVSRIDREDWKEFLRSKGLRADANFYRRVHSSDHADIGQSKAKKLLSSNEGYTEYRHKVVED